MKIAMKVKIMTDTNWPNPERPGVPLFPDRDGKHVFEMGLYPGFVVWEWSAKNKEYGGISYEAEIVYSPEEMAREYKYVGAVLTPAQIAEMLAAERERAAEIARRHMNDAAGRMQADAGEAWVRAYAKRDMANGIEAEIRNLGDVP